MATWKSMLEELPADSEQVWCRVSTFYITPVQLVWQAVPETFKSPDTGLSIPWYFVVRWKSLT